MLTPPSLLCKTGAILSDVPQDDEPGSMNFVGSTIIAVAASRDEIIAVLKNDVYAKEGVWDVDNVSYEKQRLCSV